MKKIILFSVLIVIIILLKIFVITPVIVQGNSMNNTLKNGNVVLLYKHGNVSRGKLVVVEKDGKKYIKRVIGLPGEKIRCVKGKVYINNKILEEKYVSSENTDFKEIVIGKNEYFIMGDNRIDSKDSRDFGTVSENEILGTIEFKIFPGIVIFE